MKLIELPKSPYWGAYLHVGYYPDGKKRYSPRSSKVVRDPSRLGDRGQRLDKEEALKVLTALQNVANQAMAMETEVITRMDFEAMVEGVLKACGKRLVGSAPTWADFSADVLNRHCLDLSPATARSYRSKVSVFDKWLASSYAGKRSALSPQSRISDFRLDDIQEFYDWRLTEGGESATANAAIKCLSMVFQRAIVSDHIVKNPCAGVKKRDAVSVSVEPFTLDDLRKITRALNERRDEIEFADEWNLAVRFSMFTGARSKDATGLRWSDFSDDFRVVCFLPSKKQRLHALKRVDARVRLMLPEFLAATLKAAKEASASEFVTPNLRELNAGQQGRGPRFRQILDLAGVNYTVRERKGSRGNSQRSHTFHSFRHGTKTLLHAGGVSTETNHLISGHDDPKVGARYIHVNCEDVFRECAHVFDQIESAVSGGSV